ncbi:MAG: hypothetical protein LAO51_16375 [Acidobacteriia bacterium]|nr:hypothetical protein [Terriglobia bacterium]
MRAMLALNSYRFRNAVPLVIWVAALSVLVASETGLPQPQRKGQLIAAAPFSFDQWSHDLVVEVRENTAQEGPPVRKVEFFRRGGEEPIYSFETVDGFVGFWPANGRWAATLWETGSGVVLRVFGAAGSGPGLVFERAMRMAPEWIDLDGDGEDEVLIAQGALMVSGGKLKETPTGFEVYRWNSTKATFALVNRLSWERRRALFRKLTR